MLDALREPIESGKIHISRTRAKIDYPAHFQLIAAMNPSPTGHYVVIIIAHHRNKPYAIWVACPGRSSTGSTSRWKFLYRLLACSAAVSGVENSASVRKRVLAARDKQLARQEKLNAHLESNEMKIWCPLSKEDAIWLEQVLSQLGLLSAPAASAESRPDHRRHGEPCIERYHLQEALGYRAIDRMLNHLQNSWHKRAYALLLIIAFGVIFSAFNLRFPAGQRMKTLRPLNTRHILNPDAFHFRGWLTFHDIPKQTVFSSSVTGSRLPSSSSLRHNHAVPAVVPL